MVGQIFGSLTILESITKHYSRSDRPNGSGRILQFWLVRYSLGWASKPFGGSIMLASALSRLIQFGLLGMYSMGHRLSGLAGLNKTSIGTIQLKQQSTLISMAIWIW